MLVPAISMRGSSFITSDSTAPFEYPVFLLGGSTLRLFDPVLITETEIGLPGYESYSICCL